MIKLYDRILFGSDLKLVEMLTKTPAVVVDISPIVGQLNEGLNGDSDRIIPGDFWSTWTNVAPVFKVAFLESKTSLFRSNTTSGAAGLYLLYSDDLDSDEKRIAAQEAHTAVKLPIIEVDARWIAFGLVVIEDSRYSNYAKICTISFQVSESGRVIGPSFSLWPSPALLELQDVPDVRRVDDPSFFDSMILAARNFLKSCFMALSLMNCVNIEIVDNAPSLGLSRKHERRTGRPLVHYKTLRVHPMRTIQHSIEDKVAHRQEDHRELPLHIARGHFKDYRDGKGLFGKLKGVYWWDQHVRGSVEHGVTIKDYEVQTPKEGE